MKSIFLFISYSLMTLIVAGQTPELIYKKADSLYKLKDFKGSASLYGVALKMQGKDADLNNYWRAASRWSAGNEPDSAFYFLKMLAASSEISIGDVNGIEADKDFNSIKNDGRWASWLEKATEKANANYKTEELIYGRKDGIALTMLHLKPTVKANGKAIIWTIAGSWFSSYQQAERTIRPSSMFLKKGYTVFLVILASQPRYAIPDEIDDLKRAVRYIRYNGKKMGIDPAHLGITGSSAGGHLSLCVATASEKIDSFAKDPIDRVSSRVQAAAVLFPPTDFFNWGATNLSFVNMYDLQKTNQIYGAMDFTKWNGKTSTYDHITDTAARNKIAHDISPIFYVSSDDPPIFIVHGDADLVVPLQQSQSFVAKLNEAGIVNRLVIKKGGVHNPGTMMPEFTEFPDWFDKYLK